jgi:hypothetical protein
MLGDSVFWIAVALGQLAVIAYLAGRIGAATGVSIK